MTEVKKRLILEGTQMGNDVRTVVRDIIQIFKQEDEGEFYLPNDVRENETYYNFKKYEVEIELIIQQSDDVDDFLVNGELYRDENIIAILIMYNPKNKSQILYKLIGQLNELVAHEIRHIYQMTYTNYNLNVEEPEDPFEYYTQPHEIDAQVAGFKRMSKITKRPFEEVVRNWFKDHKTLHHLNDDQVEKVVKMILDHKN